MLLLTALGTLGIDILPSYFSILYPVTYYFIGAYLRENPITMKNHQLVGLLIIVLFLQTIFTVADTNDGLFNWTLFGVENCNYNSFIVVVSAVLVFTLLSRIKIKNAFFQKLFSLIGRNTLGIYLISSGLTDNLIYPPFQQRLTCPQEFVKVIIPVVIVDFLLSFFVSIPLNAVVLKITAPIKKKLSADRNTV